MVMQVFCEVGNLSASALPDQPRQPVETRPNTKRPSSGSGSVIRKRIQPGSLYGNPAAPIETARCRVRAFQRERVDRPGTLRFNDAHNGVSSDCSGGV